MSQFQKVTPPYHDSDFKEPCLTDMEAALILLELRKAVVLFPPNHHRQHKSGCRSQKPMHDNSDSKISGLATDMNNDKLDATTLQSIGHDLVATFSNAPSDDEYPGLNETSSTTFPDHALDGTVSDITSDNEYHTASETKRVDYDPDEAISDITSEYHTARETNPSERIDCDSDAGISSPELEEKYGIPYGYGSEAVISGPGLEDRYGISYDYGSDAVIPGPELEDKYGISHGYGSDAFISGPGLEDKYEKSSD